MIIPALGKHTVLSALNSFFGDNATRSLIGRDESTAIKGLLMVLIVMGHDTILMQGGMSFPFLYSFHIYCFYFLPFLYDYRRKKLSTLIVNNLRRFYVPYTLTFLLLVALAVATHRHLDIMRLVQTYVCGSQATFGYAFGSGRFMWFIPTMFMLLIYREIYYRSTWVVRVVLFDLSVFSLLIFAFPCSVLSDAIVYAPCCMMTALAMLAPALVCRYLLSRLSRQACALAFFALIVVDMIFIPLQDFWSYNAIYRLLSPTVVFLFLLSLRHFFARSRMLIKIGDNSFKIYLIHVFLYQGFYVVVDRLDIGHSIITGVVLFPVVLVLSYGLSRLKLLDWAFPR